ncbi:hypothetical protein THF1C08_270018 [Vibrio jasicida]|uniref:Uncharacterized protein n=1 Tax=Vibrio jasicida TaxID=766224 RepID=A0AAU9QMP8_9VIBR|nr:hypothetical protein THF1C08_270018 [Vibrio jasicida]CAH1592965.1 hypothetical protein THF1A12_260018 [Vibrio jasicida]
MTSILISESHNAKPIFIIPLLFIRGRDNRSKSELNHPIFKMVKKLTPYQIKH